MTEPENVQLQKLLHDFDVAMLVTRSSNGQLRSRPMALATVEADGELWFVSDRHSAKIDEITANNQVNVAMQGNNKFVSVSGIASVVDDRARIARLWKESWKIWFPGGKDDPAILLLRIRGDAGEYWDNSGIGGMKYLLEAGRAYLTGTRPNVEGDPAVHGKVHRHVSPKPS